jgi:hypothetical protein
MALLGDHHILHVSRIRIKGHFNPLNAELNPICPLLALLEIGSVPRGGRVWTGLVWFRIPIGDMVL